MSLVCSSVLCRRICSGWIVCRGYAFRMSLVISSCPVSVILGLNMNIGMSSSPPMSLEKVIVCCLWWHIWIPNCVLSIMWLRIRFSVDLVLGNFFNIGMRVWEVETLVSRCDQLLYLIFSSMISWRAVVCCCCGICVGGLGESLGGWLVVDCVGVVCV